MSIKDWTKRIDMVAASGDHGQLEILLQDFTAAVAKGMNGNHARGIAQLIVKAFGRRFVNSGK